jgi:predicted site-specific integrase-resolvase
MDDLKRQTDFLKSKYPDHIVVTDVGSGINWKRKGLKTILERSLSGNVEEIVVAHRDRLCRFAFDLLEFIFTTTNTKLVVLEHDSNQSSEQELADDLLSIVHIYSCRKMGQRRYKNKTDKDVSKQETKETTTTMVGDH